MSGASHPLERRDAIRGTLLGCALGDALGAPTEFLSHATILRRWPPDGPREPQGDPARVTDDTQMMLAVGEALVAWQAGTDHSAAAAVAPLRDAFVAWLRDPDNDRAPGNTCLAACRALEAGMPWVEATVAGSKGCGANMRVAPVAFIADREQRVGYAQLQAALTHGHPTALAASVLTAEAIVWLAQGGDVHQLLDALLVTALRERRLYREAWLGALWARPGATDAASFIERGWDECIATLELLIGARGQDAWPSDVCELTGGGWIAEEALAGALWCFLEAPDDPLHAVRRGAATSGDSDSIAALAGALAGARHGASAWPADWLARLEYRERLERLAADL